MKDRLSICSRREFIRLAVGAPLAFTAGCGSGTVETPPVIPPPPNRADAIVAIASSLTYDTDMVTAMEQSIDLLGGIHALVNGKTVTVKVNLTCSGYFENQFGRPPGETYITHGATAMALTSLLLAEGARRVRIVDSVPILEPMEQVLTLAGWDVPALLALGNVEVENTRNLGLGQSYMQLPVPTGGYLFSSFELNHSYVDTDVFISLAKMKRHTTAGVTLSMKNLFGITPNSLYGSEAGAEDALGWRSPLHSDGSGEWNPFTPPGARADRDPGSDDFNVPRIVADECAARPVDLAIIDGITAMSGGEGPWSPNPQLTTPGILIAGLNPVSTDAVSVAVMGYSNPRAPRGTPPFQSCDNHLLLAETTGLGLADLSRIEVRGMTIAQARYPYPL
ncbi:MAG: DUF362 domain-containing protein [Terriglobia bacterium]